MLQAAKCQQNQLSQSQHLPGPTEPQSAVAVRQQAANHQQGAVCTSALHQDSVSKREFIHLQSRKMYGLEPQSTVYITHSWPTAVKYHMNT